MDYGKRTRFTGNENRPVKRLLKIEIWEGKNNMTNTEHIVVRGKINNLFHSDKKVIAARKKYRQDIKSGVSEKVAWKRSKIVYDERRNYYELKFGRKEE
ncbi:MAG: hypothetical protein ABIF11_11685 [Nitrospirota bacterium]